MTDNNSRMILRKIGICFFLSGLAALLYQTAWMRQLSVVFGTSELAVATVLTAYMSGLALGAAIAAKYVNRIRRPLLTYGLLEGGIAVSAILVPYVLQLFGGASALILGGQAAPPEATGLGQLLFYFIATLLVLIIPTALMGATLPLLGKHVVETNEQVGSRIGGLYAINTFGAVAGTLFAAFVLLPNISLTGTILIGAAINLGVLALVINVVKVLPPTAEIESDESIVQTNKMPFWRAPCSWILPVMTLSGVATFTYEVLWTRLISHILGGSVPAFAIMLAGFLIGIAAGSAIASRFAKTRQGAIGTFILSQIGIAALSALTYYLINVATPEQGGLFSNSILALSLLLPSTLFIGATYPLAVRIFANDEKDAPSASASVYSWNTVGAIFGAAFAGYFLIPSIQYSGAIVFAVCLNLVLACAVALLSSKTKVKIAYRVAPIVLLILAAVFYRPGIPDKIIHISPIYETNDFSAEPIFYDVGRSSTVLLTQENQHFRLKNNGLPESAITKKGTPAGRVGAQLLSTIPIIANPNAKNMLVAGFGGGVVVENVPPSILEVDVLELEPKVIEANQVVSELRAIDPLKDPRINIIYNDARSALQLTNKKYDVIVSQPSHPWTAGASHLYTKEYMELVEEHLSEDGVFLQWMNISFTDEYLLRSLSKTLAATFEHVRIYQFSPKVLYFLSSNSNLEIEYKISQSGKPFIDHSDYYASIGLSSVESILAGIVMDDAGVRRFSDIGKIITDNYNTLGTRSTFAVENKNSITYERLADLIIEYSPLYSSDSWIYKQGRKFINYSSLAKEVGLLRTPLFNNKINDILATINDPSLIELRANELVKSSHKSEAKKQLANALLTSQSNQQLKYQLVFLYLDGLKLGDLPADVLEHYNSLAPDAKAIIDNLIHLDLEGDKPERIESIDAVLGTAQQSDAWYSLAKRMRALWRTQLAKKNNDKALAVEAIQHIDRALLDGHDQWLHELRITAAYIAEKEAALQFSTDFVLTPAQKQLDHYKKPINMIGSKNKEAILKQFTRISDVFALNSTISKEFRAQTVARLNLLIEGYTNLHAAVDETE